MIYIGTSESDKTEIVKEYCRKRHIDKIVVFSPDRFIWTKISDEEVVQYADIIEYRFFYRLLQEINSKTLIVVNECLRTQNRNDLTYNCLRHYLLQAGHKIIFQYLPLIDDFKDFLILVDFDTRSKWKSCYEAQILEYAKINVSTISIKFTPIEVSIKTETKRKYEIKREQLFDNIDNRDPHIIPRQLHLISGKDKCGFVKRGADLFSPDERQRYFVCRNNRHKLENSQTYKDTTFSNGPYTVFEFCHRFIDFCDFITLSKQTSFDVLNTELKVDRWYLDRFTEWSRRIENAYTTIQQHISP